MLRRQILALLAVLASFSALAQDPATYERILIPVTTTSAERGPIPGANGSLWETQLTLHNRHAAPLDVEGPVCDPFIQVDPPTCTGKHLLPPRSSESVFVHSANPSYDTGAFIHIIKNANFEELPATLRVRDVSKNAQSFGTNIPTPHYDDFLQHVILTDIPTDSKYRATLRIYSADEAPRGNIKVRVFTLTGQVPIEEHTVEMTGKVILVFDPTPDHPAFAQLDPLTQTVRAAASRVRIEIEDPVRHIVSPPPPPLWAMVSITNNETQQVTIIDP